MDVAADLLDRIGRRHPAQGTAHPDVRPARPSVTLAILDRSAAWLWRLRPLWGLMWMLVLVLPWFIAIFWRAGDAFFADSIGGDMLSKLGAQESHGAPPGVYLLLFWVTFWPGAPLAGMAAPGGLAGAARARRAVSAGVADSVLDRVRTGADQTAALRAAALSGDRDPDRRRAGAAGAVAVVAEARRRLVVCRFPPSPRSLRSSARSR